MAKAGTIGNPKTLDLADMLNCEPWGALGLVEAFWDWAAEYATDGALRGIKPAVIADGVKWKGKPAKLLQLLLDSGWLDDSGYSEIGLVIHDWHHHAQDRVRKKLIRSGKTFWDGADPRTKPDERDRQMTTKERIDAYGETRAEHRDTAHEIATPCRDDTDPERTPRRDGIATAFPENGTGVALRTRVSPSHPNQETRSLYRSGVAIRASFGFASGFAFRTASRSWQSRPERRRIQAACGRSRSRRAARHQRRHVRSLAACDERNRRGQEDQAQAFWHRRDRRQKAGGF